MSALYPVELVWLPSLSEELEEALTSVMYPVELGWLLSLSAEELEMSDLCSVELVELTRLTSLSEESEEAPIELLKVFGYTYLESKV